MRKLGIIALCVAVCGCAALSGNPAPVPAPVTINLHATCIPTQDWSRADQAKLAKALIAAKSPVIMRMEKDWQAMRDAARACAKS